MLIAVSDPFSWPGADCTLLALKAAEISAADSPREASFIGSTQIRIAII